MGRRQRTSWERSRRPYGLGSAGPVPRSARIWERAMSDIEDLLEREAIVVQPMPDGLDRMLRRVARRRRNRRVAAGALALCVAFLAFHVSGGSTRPAATSEPGNYRFEVLAVRPAPPDKPNEAVVVSRLEWTTDTFPGIHRCTWSVYGADGSRVGQMTTQVLALEPGHQTPQEVEVTGAAASADVTCDPERLDVGDPYAYEFTDVKLKSAGSLSFTARWLGQGVPGAMACTVTTQDKTGRVLTRQNFTFRGTYGPEQDETTIAPLGAPATAQLQCQPYEHPFPTPSASPSGSSGPTGGIKVAVLNATDQPGLAGVTANELARAGWLVTKVGDALSDHAAVYFASEPNRAEAESLAVALFPGAPVEPVPDSIYQYASGADLVVVLGPDYRR